MSVTLDIPVADLRFDEENPRLVTPNLGQRETWRALAAMQGAKLKALAEDILNYGLNPSELSIVVPREGDENRYTVLDGNRRLAALRALESPDTLTGVLSSAVLQAIRRLSQQYQSAPLETIPCVVVTDRDEARHWIELRHTGQREGAGAVTWGSDESTRFRARTNQDIPIDGQALNWLQERGDLTPEYRHRVPVTTLRRLLANAHFRSKLGVEWSDKTFMLTGESAAVARALMHVITDLTENARPVSDFYHVKDREGYADRLPADVVVSPTKSPEKPTIQPEQQIQASQRKSSVTTREPRPRKQLIPSDCALQIGTPRLRDMYWELRKLSIDDYPNATAVLFRVFMELSADAYIDRAQLGTSPDARLSTKLQEVTKHLTAQRKLDQQQSKAINRTANLGNYLGASLATMHQWVHGLYMFPGQFELRRDWNQVQPWFIAVWTP